MKSITLSDHTGDPLRTAGGNLDITDEVARSRHQERLEAFARRRQDARRRVVDAWNGGFGTRLLAARGLSRTGMTA